MSNAKRKTYVIGHKNPDTDSICSAVAYAALKRTLTGDDYEARRAGQLNEETTYVLRHFEVTPPPLLADVRLQVADIEMHKIEGISPDISIKNTWARMKTDQVKTIPILNQSKLVGIISTGDIATSYMEVYDSKLLSEARTQYKNIIETLNGTLVTGNPHGYFTKGKVTIGASSPDVMQEFIEKDDLVILGNREEAQQCALDIDVSCVVLCQSAAVSDALLKKAKEQDIVIICTPYDTFTTARLINQSVPVRHFMTKGPFTTFQLTDYVDDIKEIMTVKKFRDFPVLDRHGNLKGFISRRRFMNTRKKQLILVDHNEKSQAVDGVEEAEIIEIIDHHRLGSIETMGPVYFRNQPVGCTATIVTQMYQEAGVEIPAKIAGILCSAIISDTLLFRSPTCTAMDETAARHLAEIAGINPDELAKEMFRAGSNLTGKSAEEICKQDFKQFSVGETTFGVGQVNSLDADELSDIRDIIHDYLPKLQRDLNLDAVYIMLTNILEESTLLLCSGDEAAAYIRQTFEFPEETDEPLLKGVVSRKKQVIPAIVSGIQQ